MSPTTTQVLRADAARDARTAVLIAAGGLAIFAVFTTIIGAMGWFPMRWRPVAGILGGLVALNLALSRTTRLWARNRLAAWIYEGVHAVAFGVVLHYCGGLELGIGFLVFAFLVIHTEMLASGATPFVTANVAATCYLALAAVESLGWVSPIEGIERSFTTAQIGVITAFGFLSLNFLALYVARSGHHLRSFASRLKDMVRERTSELHEKAQELERLNAELAQRVDEKVGELARMKALKRYLPAPLVDQVMQGRLSVSGVHDRVRLAVLVVRFRVSGLGDAPEDVAAAVNLFLDRTLDAAHRCGGVVDRFTPAGVSVLFGAPLARPLPECATAAVDAARQVLGAVDAIERDLEAQGVRARLDVSAGLTTGVATVGNFGSEDRVEYMAIGPVVEQAWELSCGDSGQLNVDEATRALVPTLAKHDTLALRPGGGGGGGTLLGGSALLPISADRSGSVERAARRGDETGPLCSGDRVDDRYEVLSVLGKGAMGIVYRVRHSELTFLRALKVIYPHLLSNPDAVRRMRCEAEALSRLSHPHIVRFYDFAKSREGDRYLAMELVEGPTLRKMIGSKPLSLHLVRLITDQVLQALEAAHAEGVVHRDLKPANVIVSQGLGSPPVAKVADFGLARLLSGVESASAYGALGTPAYMSPEQCRGESGDERSDLYSLGVILFEMLTGRRPFHSENLEGWFSAHLHEAAPDPRDLAALPDAWALLVMRALDKDPERRFQSATDMREVLLASCGERAHEETTVRPAVEPDEGVWIRRQLDEPPELAPRALHDGARARVPDSGTDTLDPDQGAARAARPAALIARAL